jgi:hypothetical protein
MVSSKSNSHRNPQQPGGPEDTQLKRASDTQRLGEQWLPEGEERMALQISN